MGSGRRLRCAVSTGLYAGLGLPSEPVNSAYTHSQGGAPGFRPAALRHFVNWVSAMANLPDQFDDDDGLALQDAKPKLKKPPRYQVVLLNDDYTPMEFVVEVLEHFFSLDRNKATQVMLHVHTRGKGVCGVYTREIAETKVMQVNEYARKHQHPLLCDMELA